MTLQIGSGLEVIEGSSAATAAPSSAIDNAIDSADSIVKLNLLLATLRARGIIAAVSAPAFTVSPTITTDGTPSVGEVVTLNFGAISGDTLGTKQIIDTGTGSVVATVTATAYTLATAGTFKLRVNATTTAGLYADSAVITVAAAADTTAPTLTSPTGTQTGSTTGTSTVSTNEANGTLYAFLSASSTPPTAVNLKTGTGAVSSASQAVTATGTQTVNWVSLTASTTYYTHWLHRDAAGNDSAIVSGTGFTTAAGSGSTTNRLLFVGDMQAGATDSLLLTGDMQSGTDYLAYQGAF